MSSVLVTGAAGFVGSHVVGRLVARGLKVSALVRPGSRMPRVAILPPAVTLLEADLDDGPSVVRMVAEMRPDVLLHLAWYTHPGDYLVSRRNLGALHATTGLVAAALDAGCRRVVGVGTCLELPRSPLPATEDTPACPDTLYAGCKHAARTVVERLTAGRASFAWARLFHLHGPGEDPARLVAMVAAKLRHGEPVALSAGEQLRDYLRVEDVAESLADLTQAGVEGTIHVCSGQPTTLRATLEAVARVFGRPDLLHFGAIPYLPADRMAITGEPTTLRQLGWRPRFSHPEHAFAYLAALPT